MRGGKPRFFVGSAREDLSAFPEDVKDVTGYALYLAQLGDKHPHAKPLHGFGGAGVLEVVANHGGDTYRTVYTVRLPSAVYVLHAFQKKSTRGVATPRREVELVRDRLRRAEAHHTATFGQEDSAR
ncbi:MAG TPA: type II toxin-antitoxin system RelE/ParE family toxin [Chloroflexota bacterium]|nr:type II toxin-antitoxin system RelE/ParE family toxin [Chloroflexota bacterium]